MQLKINGFECHMETQKLGNTEVRRYVLQVFYFQSIIFANISQKKSSQLKALKIPHIEKKTLICFYVAKGYLGHKQS